MILNCDFFAERKVLYGIVGLSIVLNIIDVDWFYQGKEDYGYITLRSTVIKILSIFALFIFVKQKEDYIIYALISCLAAAGNYFFNVYHLRKYIKFATKSIDLKPHIKPVLILLATLIATEIYTQLDTTMIGILCTDNEVGYYTYSMKLIRIIYSLTTAIAVTLLPRLSYFYINNKIDEFKKLLRDSFKIITIIAFPSTIGLSLISNNVVQILYGSSFSSASLTIRLLAPLIIIISISYLLGSIALTASNNERYLLFATAGGAVTNIILNFILIPNLKQNGAAIASVASEICVLVVHIYYARKYIAIECNKRFVVSIIISCFAMTISVISIQSIVENTVMEMLLSVLGGASIYAMVGCYLKNDTMISMKAVAYEKLVKYLSIFKTLNTTNKEGEQHEQV